MATEEHPNYTAIMAAVVARSCQHLTELGTNPKHVRGYDKVVELFSENDGSRMHPTTLDALGAVWESRCGKDKAQ